MHLHPTSVSTLVKILNSLMEKQSEGTTSSNMTLSTYFDIESALENRREEPPRHGQHQSLPGVQETVRNQADKAG